MQIKSYLSIDVGEIPLTTKKPIQNGQKLKLVIYTDDNDSSNLNVTHIEVLNPLNKRCVTGKVPKLDNTVIASMEVIIPDNWIGGRYIANVVTLEKKILCSCEFILKPRNALVNYLTEKTLRPNWLMHYRITARNRTTKPIGNFSCYIALPMNIKPFQVVKELKLHPSSLKLSSDIEGNQWVHYEKKRIAPGEKIEFSYNAKIQSFPLLFTSDYNIRFKNPYSKKFLEPYLKSEPHIESNHIEIIKMATSIKTNNPLIFAQRAIRLINRTLKYKIQPKEYGAAYAIETKEGDCTEYAALFVALCRAKGVPARTNAGFVLAADWERHATAEFMLNGRWIPVDVTGQNTAEIFIGHLPNNIIVTRGNWMGGTLAQEVSYRYQIMESSQKLDVNVDWKITMINKNSKLHEIAPPKPKKTIKILEPQISTSNSIRIIEDETNMRKDSSRIEIISQKVKPLKINSSKKSLQPITIGHTFPDVLKVGVSTDQKITLKNNSTKKTRGCFEIRIVRDGINQLLYFQGISIEPNSKIVLEPKITLFSLGITNLELVIINRIGREISKAKLTTSAY